MADVLHGLFDAFGGRGLKPISVMPCPILRRSAKRCRTITGSGVLVLAVNGSSSSAGARPGPPRRQFASCAIVGSAPRLEPIKAKREMTHLTQLNECVRAAEPQGVR